MCHAERSNYVVQEGKTFGDGACSGLRLREWFRFLLRIQRIFLRIVKIKGNRVENLC